MVHQNFGLVTRTAVFRVAKSTSSQYRGIIFDDMRPKKICVFSFNLLIFQRRLRI